MQLFFVTGCADLLPSTSLLEPLNRFFAPSERLAAVFQMQLPVLYEIHKNLLLDVVLVMNFYMR